MEGDALVIASGRTRKNHFVIGNETTTRKTVLVEVPIEGTWNVVGDTQPLETTRNLHRFSVTIEPKETQGLTVVREQITEIKLPLDRATPKYIAELKALASIDANLKSLLDQLSVLQASMNAAESEVVSIREQHRNITAEQTRIRSNLETLDKSAELYERYVKRLTEQEDLLEDLSKRLGELRVRQRQDQLELDKLLGPFRQESKRQQLKQRSKNNANRQLQQAESLDDIFDDGNDLQEGPGGLF